MPRRINTHGGGARTNANGLHFEQSTNLDDLLFSAGYEVENHEVFLNGALLGVSVPKHALYSHFLNNHGINYKDYNSKKWLPDEAFINFTNNTAYIIEKKFQNSSGSVDEKLPNCDFKKREYQKLFTPLDIHVVFIYLFNDWFKQDMYDDTLEYIEDSGCNFFFNDLPLDAIGL